MQKWRNALILFCALSFSIALPLFALQAGEYRLIQFYTKNAERVEAQVIDLKVTYQRSPYVKRTDYEVRVAYPTENEFLFFDTITEVLHGDTFKELAVGDVVDVLILPQENETREPGQVLLYKATTMEYWGWRYWVMVFCGITTILGTLAVVYAFLTRKQAVERVQRIEKANLEAGSQRG